MTYKVIGDSCLDLTEDVKKDFRFQMILLILQVDSAQVVDDETFDQRRFIEMVKACPEYPRTVCPSPETLGAALAKADVGAVFIITLSSYLGGNYNSIAVAKKLHREGMAEKGTAEQAKKMVVTDSFSASSGELNIALFIQDLYDSGLEFNEMVGKVLAYRGGMDIYFVLESLDTLRKSGRLSDLQASFATALSIKPAMGADTGTIIKLDQVRGTDKAPHRMCDIMVKEVVDAVSKIVVICHVNNPERAKYVKNEPAKGVGFKRIVVTNVVDVATVYANDGGIVLAV